MATTKLSEQLAKKVSDGWGTWVLQNTYSPSSASSVSLDIDRDDSTYRLIINNPTVSTGGSWSLRFNGDTGASDYGWAYSYLNNGSAHSAANDYQDDEIYLGSVQTVGQNFINVLIFTNSSSEGARVDGWNGTNSGAADQQLQYQISGVHRSAASVTSATLQPYQSGGATITGTVNLYRLLG